MRLLTELAAERGGLIPTYRLRQRGVSPRRIAALCHAGRLFRVRQGWYVLPGLPRSALEAVRVGGQLTCHHALEAHGVWVVRDARLHVAVDRDATQLRTAQDPTRRRDSADTQVRVHWRRASTATTAIVSPLEEALDDYTRCAPREHVAAAVDSALHLGMMSPGHRLAREFAGDGVIGVCESGIETLFWLRMRRHRLPISRQVRFSGLGRVDFRIGERLIIEVDGEEFHDTESTFESDRHRDAQLSTLGYRVLRFSYHLVMNEWPLVEAAVIAAVTRGDHLRS
ncbi:type IV toxin-antitoxin system AbiEi family antitoxin domain-containing protein [Microcella sp.]|uniref:type IV toxin-antitoxin system AbiEi family antitoxin domain-containing protein n=1 Tax=Microcella sp. TaxID=1913979 RepID=UPI0025612564|nr:type IV toxin-antitoxin system AbiEi family antitoxin domain-containing protein [Microcella sp.]MBX9472588.1 DUF559 domain-containing protein [Microcella sp.]